MKRPKVTFAYLYSQEGMSFGLMVLSAVLKNQGFSVNLILAKNFGDFIRKFARNPSKIVAFSVTTGLHKYYLSWAKRLKELGAAHTIFGGPHPTYFSDFIHEDPVDAICIGEGEESLPEYLHLFAEEMSPPGKPVAGWIHKRNGTILERNISEEQILSACRSFHSRGTRIKTYNMLGLPGETYGMAKETLDLNARGNVDYALTMLLQPFPGTEIARRAVAMGVFDGNFDNISSSYFYSSPFRFAGGEREKRRIVNLQRLFAIAVDEGTDGVHDPSVDQPDSDLWDLVMCE